MRISDWSSDVCSSELQVDRIVEVERRHGLFLLGPVASRLVPALVLRAPPEVAGILAQAELAVDLLPEAGVAQAIDPHRHGRALPDGVVADHPLDLVVAEAGIVDRKGVG